MALHEPAVDVAQRLADSLQQDTDALLLGSPLGKPEGTLQFLPRQEPRDHFSGPILCPFKYHGRGRLGEIVGLKVTDGVALGDFYQVLILDFDCELVEDAANKKEVTLRSRGT